MKFRDELKEKTVDEQEEWFLGAMDSVPLPLDDMCFAIGSLVEANKKEKAQGCADLLQDTLVTAKDGMGALRLLVLRNSLGLDNGNFRQVCLDASESVFDNRLGQGFVKSAGFDVARIPVEECLRRLMLLASLKEGSFCYNKTWGFGIVKRLDDFYLKITIDFDDKPGHEVTFAYAAEALELVGDSHILMMRHKDPDGLAELTKSDPSEVVRIVLRSYGEMSAIVLQEKIAGVILKEEDWKKFWEAARKGLKRDPLVDLPTKRTDMIKVLAKEQEYGDEWYAAIKKERDPEKILELIEVLEKESGVASIEKDHMTILEDRLRFSIKAGQWKRTDIVARSVMTVSRIGMKGIVSEDIKKELLSPVRFLVAASTLPARHLSKFMDYVCDQGVDESMELLLSVLPEMPFNVLNEALKRLESAGRSDDAVERFSPLLRSRQAGVEILLWIAKNIEKRERWLSSAAELATQAIDALSVDSSGERLKTRNQLRALFEKQGWFEGLLTEMNNVQREEIVRRINASHGWDTSSQRSLLARIIRVYPELGKVLSSAADKEQVETPVLLMTSWRSYRERQEQYRKLINVEIPQNSKDIAVARSYGDLRENFEYQAAKDQQRLLTRRKDDMEIDLDEVHGTDFVGFSCDVVGMGTIVAFLRPDGRTEQYCILGEWDRDEKLRIVSSGSKIAQLLEGHSEGNEVMLPAGQSGGDVDESCSIVSIDGLSDDVKKWIEGGEGLKTDS
ncbi:MAG: GreA/GreB family elongation factor [Kiritimatiellae bacterium]|nr:GreA/GreB family elongation factor [Kiritimatiellia bacterium]